MLYFIVDGASIGEALFDMPIPIGYKADVVIILSGFLDDFGDFIS